MIAPSTAPPRTLLGTLAWVGPGLVLASSIVGSGELIATTTVGAEAGFQLLWLVVLGCAVKVAAQVEIGRATLTWGRTPLVAFDAVPGPRLAGRGWIFWGWAVMTLLIVVQQGGVLAGVAQTLAAGLPLTPAGRAWNQLHDQAAEARMAEATARRQGDAAGAAEIRARLKSLERDIRRIQDTQDSQGLRHPLDWTAWTLITAVATAALLAVGRYGLIERVAVVLVGMFTLVTVLAVVLLQFDPAWAISGAELASGVVPSLPPPVGGRSAVATALGTFGIIGVGAAELMFYPYWCLEKGYLRAVGPREESAAWADRARGWIRVLQVDAWASMLVYTTVTVAFYLLGAATLGRLGLRPAGGEMVRTLAAMYAPVFGPGAGSLFLAGAFAVLYSTLISAADGNARIIGDGLALAGVIPDTAGARRAWTRRVAIAWPLAAAGLAVLIREPVAMVLASGVAQALMLAAIGVAVLFFRHRVADPRLVPSRAWDLLLWVSCAGLVLAGAWTLWHKAAELFAAAR